MNRPLQRRIRVIFIEDSDAHVRLYTDMLEKAFFCTFIVTVRKTLKGGLSQLSKNPFDICLLDLNLPESRGLESLAAVQKHAPHIPIVVLTGDETDDLVFKAVQQGAEDCLIKGKVDAPLLERSLAHCVDRSQLNQKIHDRENLL